MTMIRHIFFLIHPCCYEGLDATEARANNWQFFVDLESQIKAKWLATLATRPKDTLFVQLCGPEYLVEAGKKELGEAYAVRLAEPMPEGGSMHDLYQALVRALHAHLASHKLSFDPATVTSELWGESFEGCVPGYGGAFAQYLSLEQSPRMRFDMTVYDSRWLYGAKEPQILPIPESDVEAWVFECHDGTGAAIFQARHHAQWIDERRVSLDLDTMRIQVWNKRGHAVWPSEPWAKGDPIETQEYSMTLAQSIWNWIRAINMDMDTFRQVIGATRVLPPDPAESGE
jgi:hypothetical protein